MYGGRANGRRTRVPLLGMAGNNVVVSGDKSSNVPQVHELLAARTWEGVDDDSTEPVDDSLPPDGVDIIHEQDRRAGRPLTPIEHVTEERHRRCLELRQAGVNYREIARQMGYGNPGSAYRACAKARERLRVQAPDESALELRSMVYNQMRDAFQRIWPLALGGYIPPGQTHPAPPSLEHLLEARALWQAMCDLMGAKVPMPTQHHTVSGDVMVGGQVQHAHGHVVIEGDWDEDKFIAMMRRNTVEGVLAGVDHQIEQKAPSGYIAPQLDRGSAPDEPEVIEANVVDEDGEAKFDPRKAISFGD